MNSQRAEGLLNDVAKVDPGLGRGMADRDGATILTNRKFHPAPDRRDHALSQVFHVEPVPNASRTGDYALARGRVEAFDGALDPFG